VTASAAATRAARALLLTAGLAMPPPAFPQAPPVKPDSAQVAELVAEARKIAATEWAAAATYFCTPGQQPNSPTAPVVAPTRVFDNLYFIGDEGTLVHVLTTSEGIILIDSGYQNKVESVLLPGMQKLGLDPSQVKYVLVGHAHADHFGGSTYFQERFGSRVVLGAADWDALEQAAASPQPNTAKPPKRDIAAVDGQTIRLGDTEVTIVELPGHTPGGVGFVFPVKDGGRTRMAAMNAATVLLLDNPRLSVSTMQQYAQAIERFKEVTSRMNVEVEVQNHPLFDNTFEKASRLATRKPGDPHPFVVGPEGYQKFLAVISTCIKAHLARREN
jgi:metallo-beta-lactamase class B